MIKNQRRFFVVVVLTSLAFAAGFGSKAQQNGTLPSHSVIPPRELHWGPSALPGVQIAVLSGNPDKTGEPFVIRIKTKDGTKIPPHWHPTDEHITVLQGLFAVGVGEKFESSRLQDLAPGTYAFMPKQVRHFACSKGETIAQVHGIGPFQIIWVNPADVPGGKADAPKK
jgi:quercetin dioxygenase-like cupin family protein